MTQTTHFSLFKEQCLQSHSIIVCNLLDSVQFSPHECVPAVQDFVQPGPTQHLPSSQSFQYQLAKNMDIMLELLLLFSDTFTLWLLHPIFCITDFKLSSLTYFKKTAYKLNYTITAESDLLQTFPRKVGIYNLS